MFAWSASFFHAEHIGFSRRGAKKRRLRGGDFHAGTKRQGGCAPIFSTKKDVGFLLPTIILSRGPFHSFIQSASFLPLKCVILSRGVHLSYSISMSFLHAETQRQGVFILHSLLVSAPLREKN